MRDADDALRLRVLDCLDQGAVRSHEPKGSGFGNNEKFVWNYIGGDDKREATCWHQSKKDNACEVKRASFVILTRSRRGKRKMIVYHIFSSKIREPIYTTPLPPLPSLPFPNKERVNRFPMVASGDALLTCCWFSCFRWVHCLYDRHDDDDDDDDDEKRKVKLP